MTSPCTSCESLADCGACVDYDLFLAATEPATPPRCATCDEVEFLRLAGEAFDQIPGRLGIRRASLLVHLNRHGRADRAPRTTAVGL